MHEPGPVSLKRRPGTGRLPHCRHSRNLAYFEASVAIPAVWGRGDGKSQIPPRSAGLAGKSFSSMRKLVLVLVFALIVVAAGGFVVLASWDIPAPTTTMEKVIPNERLAL